MNNIISRSLLKVAKDYFVGRKIKLIIEARDIGGHVGVSRRHESRNIESNMVKTWRHRPTENGGYKFRDEIIIDKITGVNIKGYKLQIETLEGFLIERRFNEDVLLIDH